MFAIYVISWGFDLLTQLQTRPITSVEAKIGALFSFSHDTPLKVGARPEQGFD